MTAQHQNYLNRFLDSLVGIQWFSHAGEPHEEAVIVPDIVVGWDDWNSQMLAVWKPRSEELERMAEIAIGNFGIDEIFSAVSVAVDVPSRAGVQGYFDRRPSDSPNIECNVDLGLWPELLQTIKRDVSWAAIESVLETPGLFTSLLEYYRGGRWPCAWHGNYPSGQVVLL